MRVFLSVGEPSGDVHGANLVRELLDRDPSTECLGFGGPRMAAAGCRLEADMTELAIMWLSRAATNVGRFWQLLQMADRQFRVDRPDVVVLIDYPGFNWWVARRARRRGIPVVYYGAPQLWAWGGWRIGKMRRLVNRVYCMLPFEAPWYRQRGVRAEYVGHPFFDDTHSRSLDHEFLNRQRSDVPLITLLPGSRMQEVTSNLPVFLDTTARVLSQHQRVRLAIASCNEAQADVARRLVAARMLPVDVHVGRTAELMRLAHCCLACSGSVSLELLHELKPTVIHYRVGRFGLWLQQYFRRVKYITLVNLLATSSIEATYPARLYDPDAEGAEAVPFPEYLTSGDRSSAMADHLLQWLNDPQAYQRSRRWLERLRGDYGSPGATTRVADHLESLVDGRRARVPRPPSAGRAAHGERRRILLP